MKYQVSGHYQRDNRDMKFLFREEVEAENNIEAIEKVCRELIKRESKEEKITIPVIRCGGVKC